MTTATQTVPACRKAITLPCPLCGERDAGITVALHLIDDDEADVFHCCECEAEFSLTHVRELMDRWAKVLRWLDAAPDMGDE